MLNELFCASWPFYTGQWFPRVSGAIWDIFFTPRARLTTLARLRLVSRESREASVSARKIKNNQEKSRRAVLVSGNKNIHQKYLIPVRFWSYARKTVKSVKIRISNGQSIACCW